MGFLKTMRLALSRVLIAAGFVLLLGAGVGLPIILMSFSSYLLLLAGGCAVVGLFGCALIMGGDGVAAPIPIAARRWGPLAASRLRGLPIRLR